MANRINILHSQISTRKLPTLRLLSRKCFIGLTTGQSIKVVLSDHVTTIDKTEILGPRARLMLSIYFRYKQH